ncbi:MAG: SUMF1/EgtB/PvdO family nonheme iron enzyme [Desulfobacula sp.]|nr:SUMF1/EgtB/PvdO family nonheme iron enzyme [Desulfobacula sp.]
MECSNCKKEVQSDWKGCPYCGVEFQQEKECSSCGKPLDSSWKLCPFCGEKLNGSKSDSSDEKKDYTNSLGMEFVWVPEGCFQMGSNSSDAAENEQPVHEVCLDGFWMAKHTVTQRQWKQLMGENPSSFKGDDRPVETVSWEDAKDFILKLNQKSDGTYALPSEAQWEYAARSGGKDEEYSGGWKPDRVAWHESNSGGETHSVGSKEPNGLGIYDMSGNVWEWCEDVYDKEAYSKHSRNNPLVTSGGSYRVGRGGSWCDESWGVRCANRSGFRPSYPGSNLGFRLIRKN